MSSNDLIPHNVQKQIVDNLLKSGRMFDDENDVIPEKKFFPQKPGNDENIIYINQAMWDRLRLQYLKTPGLRKVINNFIKNPDSHEQFQQRIPNLMINAAPPPIGHGEFWNIEIIGGPGSGKSMFMRGYLVPQHAGKLYRNFTVHCDIDDLGNSFTVDMGEFLKANTQIDNSRLTPFQNNPAFDTFVTYDIAQTNHVVKDMFKGGDVIFEDETPVLHGKGSKTSVDSLENILKASARALNLNFCFISPSFIPIETVHYYVRIIGYVKSRKITVACLQTDKDDYIGVAEFQLIDIPGLGDYYERVSREKKKIIKESSGYVSYKPSEKEMKELVSELIDIVKEAMDEDGITSASQKYIKAIAMNIDKIRNTIDKDDIIERAYRKLKGMEGDDSQEDQPESDDTEDESFGPQERSESPGSPGMGGESLPVPSNDLDDFIVTRGMIEAAINKIDMEVKKSNPRSIQYYLAALDKNMVDVAVQFGVTEGAISQAWSKINPSVCEEIGRVYEPWYADYLRRHATDFKIKIGPDGKPCVFHDGKSSKHDILVEHEDGTFEVISVKWRNPHQGKPSFSIAASNMNPEIIKAQILENEGKIVKVTLHVRIKGHKKTIDEPVNFKNPKANYSYNAKRDF